jgi:internalin A
MTVCRILPPLALVGALLALTGCGAKPDPQPLTPPPHVELQPEPPKPQPKPAPTKDKEPAPLTVADAVPPLTPADTAKLEALQKAGASVHGPEDDGGYVVRIEQDTKLESALAALRGLKCVTNLTFDNGELTDSALASLEELEYLSALVLSQCSRVSGTGLSVLSKLMRLKAISVVGPLTDVGCKHIASAKALQEVRLIGTKVTAAGLRELAALPKLDTLAFDAIQVTGGCFVAPGWSKLRDLDASRAAFVDREIEALAALPAIEVLRLDSTGITDNELVRFRGAKAIAELYLSDTRITDTGLRELAGLTKLRVLDVSKTKITGVTFDRLPAGAMRKLVLDGTGFNDEGAAHLARFTELVTLSAAGCPVSDAGLKGLSKLTKLTKADLSDTKAGDGATGLLGALPALELVSLDRTALTDAGLKELVRAPRLRFVEARGTKVTKPGAAEAIRFGPPGLKVEVE